MEQDRKDRLAEVVPSNAQWWLLPKLSPLLQSGTQAQVKPKEKRLPNGVNPPAENLGLYRKIYSVKSICTSITRLSPLT